MYRWCPDCSALVQANEFVAHCNRHVLIDRQQRGVRAGSTTAWRKLRALIIERDDHRCQQPGCTETTMLEVHHVNGDPKDDRPANLQTLCHTHHAQARRTRRPRNALPPAESRAAPLGGARSRTKLR